MSSRFKFCCALFGHRSDVRTVDWSADGTLISGSRDFTARSWRFVKESNEYKEGTNYLGHEGYVSAVAHLPGSTEHPSGFVVTGCHDAIIRLFVTDNPKPLFSLKGHTDTVCSLSAVDSETFISGSWDRTARVWKKDKCVAVITDHEAVVWAVLLVKRALDTLVIATGAADNSVRIFLMDPSTGEASACTSVLQVMRGHTDCVRAVVRVDDDHILSASNDASIRAWDVSSGTCVGEFYGHTNFIYSLTIQSQLGLFVSSGEDRSIRVWPLPSASEWRAGKQFDCLQTVALPCQSAWCVAISSLGDVAVGCSDSILRVFSSDASRQAPEAAQLTYKEEVASSEVSAVNVPGNDPLDTSKLPGVEALLRPGLREGQILLINENNRPICYQWSTAEGQWNKIGDVVGSDTKRHMHEGKEYDFVFDVDIDDSVGNLRLPYNRSDDPWFVAQAFIHEHDLPQAYLDTVAQFIIRNAGPRLEPSAESQGPVFDPFTGTSRYVPGTGISAGSLEPVFIAPTEMYIPATDYITLRTISLSSLLNKLESFNMECTPKLSKRTFELANKLNPSMAEDEAVELAASLLEVIDKWSVDKIFPLLDLLRCLVCVRSACHLSLQPRHWPALTARAFTGPNLPTANYLLGFRLLANIIALNAPLLMEPLPTDDDKEVVSDLAAILALVPILSGLVSNPAVDLANKKQHQVALATLIHNLSLLAYCTLSDKGRSPGTSSLFSQTLFLPGLCVRVALSLLKLVVESGPGAVTRVHPDAIFSLLVAIGTAMMAGRADHKPAGANETDGDAYQVEAKSHRLQLLASAMATVEGETVTFEMTAENIFNSWEKARHVIEFWAKASAAPAKVRGCASALLHLVE